MPGTKTDNKIIIHSSDSAYNVDITLIHKRLFIFVTALLKFVMKNQDKVTMTTSVLFVYHGIVQCIILMYLICYHLKYIFIVTFFDVCILIFFYVYHYFL